MISNVGLPNITTVVVNSLQLHVYTKLKSLKKKKPEEVVKF